MNMPFVRHPYNYDRDAVSLETGYASDEPSMTQQGPTEDADINTIVRRFGVTGQLPQGARMPTYGDFETVGDFHTAMEVIRKAEEAFMLLPGETRQRFRNDPGEFMAFVEDEKNAAEAEKLGFLSEAAILRRRAAVAPPVAAAAQGSAPPSGGSSSPPEKA